MKPLAKAVAACFALFILLFSLAAGSNPDFTLFKNYLSDLGARDAPSAVFFNSALVFGGIGLIVLGVVFFGKRVVPGVLCAISGIALFLVALFPEGDSLHKAVSILFFTIAGLSVLAFTVQEAKERGARKAVVGAGILQVALSLLLASTFAFEKSLAPLFETLAVASLCAWGVVAAAIPDLRTHQEGP